MNDDFVGLREIEKIVGLNANTIYKMRKLDKFPKPANEESRVPLWNRSIIEAWVRSYKRIPCYVGK